MRLSPSMCWPWLLLAARAIGATVSPMEPISATDSVLIVAPHPDDESLCCAGLIYAARQAGAKVAIVWITNGDGFRWSAMVSNRAPLPRASSYKLLAMRRAEEARAAATALGVEADSLFFLGYPDRGVLALMNSHYSPPTAWRSRFTGANTVIYPDAFEPGALYDGQNLARNFEEVLDRVRPTLVFAPSLLDAHRDHRGAGLLTERALAARGESSRLRLWIVHGGQGWPHRLPRQNAPQSVAPRGQALEWMALPLSDESIAAKVRAIAAHRTQTRVMGGVMRRYARSTELFAAAESAPSERGR